MIKKICTLLVVITLLANVSGLSESRAYAAYSDGTVFGAAPEGIPSVFDYGWRGLFLGALSGLAAGYIRYGGENPVNNNEILRSVGYGSLAGAGIGLIAGFNDISQERYGMGYIFLRDMYRSGGFGVAVGSIWGGINALIDSKWERLGNGAAWGFLGGVLLGAGIAAYEGPKVLGLTPSTVPPPTSKRIDYHLAFFEGSGHRMIPGVRAVCRFN